MRLYDEFVKRRHGCERRQALLALPSGRGPGPLRKGVLSEGKITLDRLWINIQTFEYISKLKTMAGEDGFVVKFQTVT